MDGSENVGYRSSGGISIKWLYFRGSLVFY